jgi:hypothetical protein
MTHNFDKTLLIQIYIWMTCNGISMVAVWALLIAIFRSPKVRTSPFNLYLVFSLVPDAVIDLTGFVANLTNVITDAGSPNVCKLFGWNDPYWWCAHLWMSFSVILEIHKMLMANKMVRRYKPPTLRRVILQSTAIHAFSVLMASLTLIPADFIPNASFATECAAYPEPGNKKDLIYFWAFFIPVTAIIPTILVSALCIDIWRKKLLPPKSQQHKSRSLLLYFGRLLGTLYIVFVAVLVSSSLGSDWVSAIAFAVFKLVGLFQVCLALLKKDIKNAWIQMWCCRSPSEGDSRDSTRFSFAFSSIARRKSSINTNTSGILNEVEDEGTGRNKVPEEAGIHETKDEGTGLTELPDEEAARPAEKITR